MPYEILMPLKTYGSYKAIAFKGVAMYGLMVLNELGRFTDLIIEESQLKANRLVAIVLIKMGRDSIHFYSH